MVVEEAPGKSEHTVTFDSGYIDDYSVVAPAPGLTKPWEIGDWLCLADGNPYPHGGMFGPDYDIIEEITE
jgi:hypothetical protein